jgi:AsmA protein
VRRLARWLAVGLLVLVVLAAVLLAAVPYLVDVPRIQGLIAHSASQALGRPVKFSGVSISVFPLPAVVLEDLEVAEDPAFGGGPFLRVDRAEVRLRLWPLLLLRVELGDFVLQKPSIALIKRADGRWNIASLGAAGEPRGPSRPRSGGGGGAATGAVLGSRVKVDDGVITYESRGGGRAARYRIEDLDLTVRGGRLPLAFEGDATVKPGDLDVKISDGTLALDGARTIQGAAVRARLALDGKNVRDLVAVALGPEPAITGGVTGALSVGGTVGDPRATGDLQLTGMQVSQTTAACPEPKRRTLDLGTVKVNAAFEGARATGRPVTASLGGGTITGNVALGLDGGMRVEVADLGIKGVPVERVLVDFLCQGYAVTGPLDLSGGAAARLADVWRTLDGQGQVRIGPGRVVGRQALTLLGHVARTGGGVSSLLRGEAPATAGSPLDYDSITATYTIAGGVVTTRDLVFTSRALRMAAAGTYALASGAMNLDVTLRHGSGELRAKVTGSAASPSISIAPESVVRGLDEEKVQKGLQELLKRFP